MTETKKAKGGNQIVRLALILFVVSAITSGVLGLVNMLTKDTIAAQEEAARAASSCAAMVSLVSMLTRPSTPLVMALTTKRMSARRTIWLPPLAFLVSVILPRPPSLLSWPPWPRPSWP